jgi:uncharacterized membrane protein
MEPKERGKINGEAVLKSIKERVKKIEEREERKKEREEDRAITKKEIIEEFKNKKEAAILPKTLEIQVKDRYIWINNYLLSKPHAVGTNFEFFDFIRRQPPNEKITKQKMPDSLKKEVGSKRFAKLLNELGFKDEILKAFFPKRGKNMVAYRGDKITKKDLEKAGIKIPLFLKELELAHIKNSPK